MGEFYRELCSVTSPRMKEYAQRIGADFIVIDEQKVSQTSPHWEKFQLYEYLKVYDRIVYLDCDILVNNNAENLFNVVPIDKIGMFNEAPFTANRQFAIEKGADEYNIKSFTWNGKYFNSGVMVLSSEHKALFIKPEKEIFNFYEQTYLNLIIQRDQLPVHNLHYKYNRMTCMDQLTGEPRYQSQFIHYAGLPSFNAILEVAKKDNEYLLDKPADYKWQRNIWINVQGGLGDQIQAEPTVRYLLKHIYPNENVRVSTHFPQIFQHLAVAVYPHGKNPEFNNNTAPFEKITLPKPDTPMWQTVSNLLCHTVDFASMAVLKRILPDKDKSYILEFKPDSYNKIRNLTNLSDHSDCVLVHAGRHWESKTFPDEWWEGVIDNLLAYGLTPILIGKTEETRGVVRLDNRDGVINLVNLLTLDELFAITNMCPVLISNDSAPIHIAGAFDNWIILIPSCKHPDHILPYRYGSKTYKTKALYKSLTLDDVSSAPTEIYEVLGDKIAKSWDKYLPLPEEVAEEAYKIIETKED